MTIKRIWVASVGLLALPLVGLTSDVIPMDQEPPHHLALQNEYVKVFNVLVSPGDLIVLHRHDRDTLAIAMGDQLVTVGVPGEPDVHQKNADGQVRLQRSGYAHSTHVDGDTPYRTVAVELMQPQANFHNLCGEVLAGQPLSCASEARSESQSEVGGLSSVGELASRKTDEPLIASDQTTVRLIRLASHESLNPAMNLGASSSAALLLVALDDVTMASSRKAPGKVMQPGDFLWFEGGAAQQIQNRSHIEVRLILFHFRRPQ